VDFYKFSCGGWQKNNPIPADQATWSVYGKLAQENQQFLWGILEQDAKATNRTPVQQKIGDYFAACMNTAAIDEKGYRPLEPALQRLDAISSREQVAAALALLQHRLSGSYFFGSRVDQDATEASLEIVQVNAGGLGAVCGLCDKAAGLSGRANR
jgi:endothelin-converting enzyme/putative endopeptidase